MAITSIEVRLLALTQVEPFAASHGEVVGSRPLAVVRVLADEGSGWGECAALPSPGYAPEWAAGAFASLRDHLAPLLLGQPLTVEATARSTAGAVAAEPMAVAALEQAVLDASLRAEGRSLAGWLGVGPGPATVPAGAVVGLAPTVEVLIDRVAALVAAGYRRVKVKIQPGWDVEPLRALRAAFPDLDLQADANGSYRGDDADGLVPLLRLAALGLSSLEQPLPPDDLVGAARLRRRLGVPLAADESASTPAGVDAVLAAGAADVVVVKPARLGGLAAARAVHQRCLDAGVALMAGGMVEAGAGRRALAAVAALPGFTVTGDCSPAQRWLADDPWPPMDLVDGAVAVHAGPGVAPDPDPDRLVRVTAERATVGAIG